MALMACPHAERMILLYGCACSTLIPTILLSLSLSAASPQGRSLPLRLAETRAFAKLNNHVHTCIKGFCLSIMAARAVLVLSACDVRGLAKKA